MPVENGYRVLIIGCGQLGSRHLQAVASMPTVAEIDVVDPRPEAWQLGQERLEEIQTREPSPKIRWHSTVGQAPKNGDLCIIATQAAERCMVMREAAESLGYTSFLLEKIVAQSIKEMEGSVALAASLRLKVWVNTIRRASPFYQRVKAQLDPGDPVIFNSVGGNLFLATDGVHEVDLFAFYDGCPVVNGGASIVDSTLHHSKRGNGLYDLTGILRGSTEKGSSLTISYTQCDTSWTHLSISTSRYRCIIDHLQQWSFESNEESDWEWRQVPYQETLLVSQTTAEIADNILTSGKCDLPSLEQSLVSHRFILGELQPHFSKLLGRPIDQCPVT